MNLPAVDLGIMAEHLSTHEGVINKLKMYHTTVKNSNLKNLIHLHIKTLRNHVTTMLLLIDPDRNREVHLPKMDHVQLGTGVLNEMEKDITLELRAASKLMGSDNFNSALLMKNMNVKNIHLQMSYQDITLQMMYNKLINRIDGDFVPMVTKEMQRRTIQKFYHVQKE